MTDAKHVVALAEFIGLFYAKAFLLSPLSSSAPKNELDFMVAMRKYRQHKPGMAAVCLTSTERHLWYLTPRLVVFSLADKSLPSSEREEFAKKLFVTPKPEKFKLGKQAFPIIDWPEDKTAPKLSSFVSGETWFLFDLIGLSSVQEWMQAPAEVW